MKEQRLHERYEVKEGTLVLIGPDYVRTGRIVNMGHGGLSFLYRAKNKIKDNQLGVSIIFDGHKVAKYGPFKLNANIVNNNEVEEENPGNPATMNRYHIEFNDLSYHQQLWLEDCIRNHTTGPVKSVKD